MKRILLLITLLSPLLLNAQGNAPKENKLVVEVLHPLNMQINDFEKNLAQHTKEFHKGNFAVDIYEVLTGNRRGEYHFVFRNPLSWAGIESTFNSVGDKSHANDWDLNVGMHASENTPLYIYESSDDSYISPNPADMQTGMLALYFIDVNMGMEEDFFAGIKKIKEMFQKNSSKGYYRILVRSFGEGTQVVVVLPLPKGWASFEPNPDENWEKMFKVAFPKEDFKAWMKKFDGTQKSFETLVVKHRDDLSSPK